MNPNSPENKNADRSKSEFLSRVSHELRTPLNVIIGMTNIALGQNDVAKIKDSLNKVSQASKHLLNIVNDILDISKIEAGRLTLERKPFSLETVWQAVQEFTSEESKNREVDFTLNINPNIPVAYIGDVARLTQVIINLLSNAVKFSPDHPKVTLEIDAGSRRGDEQELIGYVRDNGIGIEKNDLDRIFNSFEQGQNSTARSFEGTGLGLPIVRMIIRMMGGDIHVTSEKGKGSVFGFNCWLKRNSESAARPKAFDFTGNSVLVFEDVELNREIIVYMLEPTGADLEFAFDGAMGMRMLEDNPEKYDLILMDIQMPGIDGYEAARLIRASGGEHSDIPIIAMTANVFDEDIARALESGMNGHVGKPMDDTQLKTEMAKFISAKYLESPFREELPEPEPEEKPQEPPKRSSFVFNALDPAVGLAQIKGNKTLYLRLCKSYAANNAVGNLRDLLEKRDLDGSRAALTALKGSSQNIGAVGMVKQVSDLETALLGATAIGHAHMKIFAGVEKAFEETKDEIGHLEDEMK